MTSRTTTAGPQQASWRPGTQATRAPSPSSFAPFPFTVPVPHTERLPSPLVLPRATPGQGRPAPPRHLDSPALCSLARSCESAPRTVSVAAPNSQTHISAHARHQDPLSARAASLPAQSVHLGAHFKVTRSQCSWESGPSTWPPAPQSSGPQHAIWDWERGVPHSHRHAPLPTPRSGEKQKMLTVLGPGRKYITQWSSKAILNTHLHETKRAHGLKGQGAEPARGGA